MMHDIRNFCTAQLLIVDRLLRTAHNDPLTPKQLDLLKRAQRQAQYMHRTVEDMRLLTRLQEQGASSGETNRLIDVLDRALGTVRALHFDRPFDAAIKCPCDLTTRDTPLLESIFINLFDNAVRHTSKELRPRIDLHVTAEETAVAFAVRGGTPPEKQVFSHLFERHTKGAPSTGLGLGLALIRDIIEEAGGRIEARLATTSQGQVFEVAVRLPKKPPLLGCATP